jgi:hypothetical protein
VTAGPEGPSREQLDERVVRRAVRAGLLALLVLTVVTQIGSAVQGGDGIAAGIWLTSSIVMALLVTSGWLVLALVLDLIAGEVPGRRRMLWTAAVFGAAFISPVLVVAMLQVAAESGAGA